MVFDIRDLPPSPQLIASQRLTIERTLAEIRERLSRLKLYRRILLALAITCTALTLLPSLLIPALWGAVCVYVAIVVITLRSLAPLQTVDNLERELATLLPVDEVESKLSPYDLQVWSGMDQVVKTYLDCVTSSGRKVVAGEYLTVKLWVANPSARDILAA